MNKRERQTVIVALRTGLRRPAAAALAGVTLAELRAVLDADKTFRAECRRVVAELQAELLQRAQTGNANAAWLLERRFPPWRKTTAVTVRTLPADKLIEADPDEVC